MADVKISQLPTILGIDNSHFFVVSDGITTSKVALSTISGFINPVLEYLVVGGGGGPGAYSPGGGGAGGFRSGSISNLTPGTVYDVVVGAGGAKGAYVVYQYSNAGQSGGNSRFGSVIASGGGGGGGGWQGAGCGQRATSGGSGGGGGGYWSPGGCTSNDSGAAGNSGGYTPSEGNSGGSGANLWAGAGGGAGGAGQSASANYPTFSVANGGIGKASSITGTPTYYAGGGAGQNGTGGLGGGGTYAEGQYDGVPNTGGGGSGTGAGGSGIVVVAYPGISSRVTITGVGATTDLVSRPGFVVHRFLTVGNSTLTWNG